MSMMVQNGIVDDSWGVSLGPSLEPTSHEDKAEGDAHASQCINGQPKLPDKGQSGQGSLSGMQQRSLKQLPQKGSSSSGNQADGPNSAGLRPTAPHSQSTGSRLGASSRGRGQRGSRGLHDRGRSSSHSALLGRGQRGRHSKAGGAPQAREHELVTQ